MGGAGTATGEAADTAMVKADETVATADTSVEELERFIAAPYPTATSDGDRAKRRLVPADRRTYSMDDAVSVWSVAVGKDLFPWFRSLGFQVDPARTDLVEP